MLPLRSPAEGLGERDREVLARLERFASSPEGVLLRLEHYTRRRVAASGVTPVRRMLETALDVVQLGWLLFSCTLTAVVTVVAFAVFPEFVAVLVAAGLAAVGVVVTSEVSHWPRWWTAGVVIGVLVVLGS